MSTAARRRRRRAALVLTALVALLIAVAGYAVAYYQGWLPGTEGGDIDQVTATSTAPSLAPSDVTVNVYNASGVTGIAGRTSQALSTHGFQIDAVADAPAGTQTPEVAEIRFGAANQEAAELLATYISGAVLVEDTREINEIDLYIGTDFVELEPAPGDSPSATG
nr:LytR C-terminal domain-containing protein [Ornithinimicrobium sp. F0845]